LSTKVLGFYNRAGGWAAPSGTWTFFGCLISLTTHPTAMQFLIQKQKNLFTVAMVAALSVSGPRARALEKENTAKPAKAELPQLQLAVDVPPQWRPFLSDDLAEAFASRLTDVFRRRGYAGEVRFLDHDDPKSGAPLLTIRLINWRVGRIDNAECTFTASLKNGSEEHELGIFENTSFAWNNNGTRWGLADVLGDVADGALTDLSSKLSKDDLLPGFSAAKKS
jgi:hypothetical protein